MVLLPTEQKKSPGRNNYQLKPQKILHLSLWTGDSTKHSSHRMSKKIVKKMSKRIVKNNTKKKCYQKNTSKVSNCMQRIVPSFESYFKLLLRHVNIVRFLIVVVFHFNQELRLRHIFIYCCFLVSSQREKREIHTTWSLIYVTRANYI